MNVSCNRAQGKHLNKSESHISSHIASLFGGNQSTKNRGVKNKRRKKR